MKKRILPALIGLLLVVYIAIAAYMGAFQRSFIYAVAPQKPAVAAASVPGLTETDLVMADGVRLNTWIVPPTAGDRPIYVYFHGNANTLMRRAERFRLLTSNGSGLLAIHYRGYGGSGGKPTEALLHKDAEAAFAEAEKRFPGRKLVAFGESLGSSIAIRLASERPQVAAVVLDCPFVSVLSRAQASYPWLPVSLLLVDTFRSDRWIGTVKAPIFIMHGALDRVTPIEEGRKLFALAPDRKRFVAYPDAGHVDNFRFGAADAIWQFLKDMAVIPG
ncbi:MAG TPA: alpha/beta hydrolase [Beijerinckiaceae bacterium]|nr:alpha/beta hydrolase [Beijerinckiaceae bacterium]